MNHSEGQVGMRVLFGRTHGEQTEGVIVKVNPKKFKVRQLGSRGSFVAYPDGTVWTVPASLCSPMDAPGVRAPLIAYHDALQSMATPRRRRMSRENAGIARGMAMMRRFGED